MDPTTPTATPAGHAAEPHDDTRRGMPKCMMSRRNFLLASGAATTAVSVMLDAGTPLAHQVPGVVASYPRKLITKLSSLKPDRPFNFQYPDEGAYSESMVVKLGVEAGGGIGPARDVVAFNYICTHQGGDLSGTYRADTKSLGACPLHLSTYDLTRHGMIITGHATESLPQVLLESEGDDIHATGLIGLIYGHSDNLRP